MDQYTDIYSFIVHKNMKDGVFQDTRELNGNWYPERLHTSDNGKSSRLSTEQHPSLQEG